MRTTPEPPTITNARELHETGLKNADIASTAGVSRRTPSDDFKSESAVSHFENHPPPTISTDTVQRDLSESATLPVQKIRLRRPSPTRARPAAA